MDLELKRRARMISEKELQRAIVECAQALGYTVAYFRPAMTNRGYRTPVGGDGKGFPDLVIVGHGRTLFRELKSYIGKLRADQKHWAHVLTTAGADWGVWTPVEWLDGTVEAELA